ncbi:phage antirepressor KilAC domain-containing protein [Methylobacterium sp. J-068]|uniref:phage antirepressor KilAC domain-containing protein n=1 Tax=Methylobacterium sp. J-068 TaxID=2836649 RepID=UPI001FB9A30D|nr:phage antirepressor KilAC domain-containing protein [Methylobacterium sp. J-068]MCJ2035494.1 phage antirepressor KilAC domain-containing protein [Methylobacterium sp. J-068]
MAVAPAVAFIDALADSDGLWGLYAAAKALHQEPVTLSGGCALVATSTTWAADRYPRSP